MQRQCYNYNLSHYCPTRREVRAMVTTKTSESLKGYMLNPRTVVSEQRVQIRLTREVEYLSGNKKGYLKMDKQYEKYSNQHIPQNSTEKDEKVELQMLHKSQRLEEPLVLKNDELTPPPNTEKLPYHEEDAKALSPENLLIKPSTSGFVQKDKEGKILKGDVPGIVDLFCNDERNNLMKAFVWTYTSFCTTTEMLNVIIERYETACNDDEKGSLLVRARIISAIKYWIENVWNVIKTNEKPIDDTMKVLLNTLRVYGMNREYKLISSCFRRATSGVEVQFVQMHQNVELPIPTYADITGAILAEDVFNNTHPIEYARQVTLVVSEKFRKVKLYEMLLWANGEKDRCVNIIALQTFFNGLQNYFTTMILNATDISKRIGIIERLIKIAGFCFSYRNFDTLLCILLLFGTSAIHRLKRTFDGIAEKSKTVLKTLKEFSVPDNNWDTLRKETKKSVGKPMVPYIGLILSDLTFTNYGNKTKENGLINFGKCQQISSILEQVVFMHQQTFFQILVPQPDIQLLIEKSASFDKKDILDDKRSYELSNVTEPKVSVIVPLSSGCTRLTLHIPGRPLVVVAARDSNVPLNRLFLETLGCDVSRSQLFVFYSGQSVNEVTSPFSPVSQIKIAVNESEVLLTALNKTMFVNVVFEFNGVMCRTMAPMDPTIPLEQMLPILKMFSQTPSYPILVKNNKVIGLMQLSATLDEIAWEDENTIYFLPFTSLKNTLSDVSYDSLRFKTTRFFMPFTLRHEETMATLVIVDLMVVLYIENTFKSVYPIDQISLEYDPWKNSIRLGLLENELFDATLSPPVTLYGKFEVISEFIEKLCVISPFQRKTRLFGTKRNKISCDALGIPKKFLTIVKSLFDSGVLKNESCFDVDKNEVLLYEKQFEEKNVFHLESAPGLLILYLVSLHQPLLPRDHTKHFVSFDFLDKEDKDELLRRAFEDLDEMEPITIVVIQLLAFHYSLSKTTTPQFFEDLLFENMPVPGLSGRVLDYLIKNSSVIVPKLLKISSPKFGPILPVTDFLPTQTILEIVQIYSSTNVSSQQSEELLRKNIKIIPHIFESITSCETPRRLAKRNMHRLESLSPTKQKSKLTLTDLSNSPDSFENSPEITDKKFEKVEPSKSPIKQLNYRFDTHGRVINNSLLPSNVLAPSLTTNSAPLSSSESRSSLAEENTPTSVLYSLPETKKFNHSKIVLKKIETGQTQQDAQLKEDKDVAYTGYRSEKNSPRLQLREVEKKRLTDEELSRLVGHA
ncbi:guanine nucleotide exchange factor, putative [Entamoeba invadens IP1]|uniref:Guanine nucleotide exchange factor, putative n=1 Tax=Entamoeba invadens IP1 TaxID=370355 RepID=A0A0A1U0M5_ENTIV|nr:guanine nucleotide exchange factor, putative [Entamoeba invadens IP1]ELP86103.1 guanine nucleotide exchange factor, putative [Entamoeba invadens IP1]|eukprot:XP_004185449.1 guanine nucleotide exchange factor, putative [Entamoeba invadens IP1]